MPWEAVVETSDPETGRALQPGTVYGVSTYCRASAASAWQTHTGARPDGMRGWLPSLAGETDMHQRHKPVIINGHR